MDPPGPPVDRRTFLRALGAGATGTAVGASLTDGARAADGNWSMFGHDGQFTFANPTASDPRESVETHWSTTVETDQVSFPVVRDGTVYLSAGGSVRGFDLDSGENTVTESVSESVGLVFSDERAYTATDTEIHAYDPRDWSRQWSASVGFRPLLPVTTQGYVAVGSTQQQAAVFDAETGERVFQTDAASDILFPPIISEDRAFVVDSEAVRLFDLSTGDPVWRTDASHRGNVFWPCLHRRRLFVGSENGVVAYERGRNGPVWSHDGANARQSAAFGSELIATMGQQLLSLDVETGEPVWETSVPSEIQYATVGGSTVYTVGRNTMTVRAYDGTDGSQLLEHRLVEESPDQAFPSAVIPVGDRLAVYISHRGDNPRTELFVLGPAGQATTTQPEQTPTGTLTPTPVAETDTPTPVPDPSEDDSGLSTEAMAGLAFGGFTLGGGALYALRNAGSGDTAELPASAAGPAADDGPAHADSNGGTAEGSVTTASDAGPPAGSDAAAFATATGLAITGSVGEEALVHRYAGEHGNEGVAEFLALAPDVDAGDAFERAATQWSGISANRAITSVYEVGTEPRPWLAADGRGRALSTFDDSLDRDTARRIFEDVADALTTARRYNVQHHGLDPDCIRVAETEAGHSATVGDWGLRRAVHEAVGEPLVTPYTAPEQLPDADGHAGRATDVHAAGALAYLLLTGRPPFQDASDVAAAIRDGAFDPPSELDPSLPAAVDEVVENAMAVDPAARPDSLTTLQDRLFAALD